MAQRRHEPQRPTTDRLLKLETRLALSASASASALLDLWDFDPQAGVGSSEPTTGDSLLAQAAQLQQTYDLDGAGQTVAVIDSGIAYDHIALGEGYGPGYRVVGGWDFAENDANPYDDGPSGFHGTHVAGLVGGSAEGFQGMAPEADLVALRVFDDMGSGQLDWIEDALGWVLENQDAFENPITTVNLSLGASFPEELFSQVQGQIGDELQMLRDEGIMVFAASGNAFDAANPNQLAYPASSDHVVGVGSIAGSGDLSFFSQRSDGILVAPGENVNSAVPDHVMGRDGRIDDFAMATGTSMASPQISGAAMLVREAMIQAGAEPDSESVIRHLYDTADRRVDSATGIAYHEVNLTRAVESFLTGAAATTIDSTESVAAEPELPVVESQPDPVEVIGSVDSFSDTLRSNTWYEATATQDGLFSIALGDSVSESFNITIEDAQGNRLSEGLLSPENQIDVTVDEGMQLRIRFQSSASQDIDVAMANLVQVQDQQVTFQGTQHSEQLRLDLRSGTMLGFSQFQYHFQDGSIAQLQVNGGANSDTLEVTGSDRSERFTLHPNHGRIESGSLTITVDQMENTHVDGGGGYDRAYLHDSPGRDTLTAHPQDARLTGSGYDNRVENIRNIYTHAKAGGVDSAYLYDSEFNDRLAIRPNFTSLRGDEYFNLVFGFDRVSAFGTGGGHDTANLYDSPNDDRMSANADSAYISGPGYFSKARHFESVTAHATAGGNDYATLYAHSNQQSMNQSGDLTQLRGDDGSFRAARGFEKVDTFLNGSPIVVSPASAIGPVALPSDIETAEAPTLSVDRVEGIQGFANTSSRDVGQIANLLPASDSQADEERGALDDLFASL